MCGSATISQVGRRGSVTLYGDVVKVIIIDHYLGRAIARLGSTFLLFLQRTYSLAGLRGVLGL